MELTVNGVARVVEGDPDQPLLYVLRDQLELTGAKYGCGEGQCGACTVLLEGVAVRSCRIAARAAQGKRVTTIEGLEQNGRLHPVQQAFIDADAMQCGYCTPAMILAAAAMLSKNPEPKEAEIARSLQGNICRCGTYPRIIAAVRLASGLIKVASHA